MQRKLYVVRMTVMMVMTGGTRGLGRVAATRLATLSDRKIMGARSASTVPVGWEAQSLDLASLASVRAFAAALPNEPVTHLILNAGGQRPTVDTRTIDGFETTFASNHLAHYLLLRLLMPRLAQGARIVITSSGTHDPLEKTGVPPPRHADAELLAHPDRDLEADSLAALAGMRAYSASKLCNLMTALYLAESNQARAGHWLVFAYDPGLTPGTGLVRDQSWLVQRLVWPLLPLLVPLSKGMNTLADAGRGLADLAAVTQPPSCGVYAALRKGQLTWPDPSLLARDEAAIRSLWEDSARMTGLN
jgi:NAD(P)-dependent dehydrogenase (short-subunit alcohol dehydrogenase family)